MSKTEEKIKSEVKKYHEMELKLLNLENALTKNKEFREFLNLQRAVNAKADEVWSDVETTMIDNGIKTIDTDWVKLTIVESSSIKATGTIAAKFTKHVPDTKKINEHIESTGEIPEGVEKVEKRYLRKTFRPVVS